MRNMILSSFSSSTVLTQCESQYLIFALCLQKPCSTGITMGMIYSLQVKVMKSLFADFKTPTMAQCEMLGSELGLCNKRVVQVFFQNQRAKEKKGKIPFQKTSTPESPHHCNLCGYTYATNLSVQDHIFTKAHIDAIKAAITNGTFPERHLTAAAPSSSLSSRPNGEIRKAKDLFSISSSNQQPADSTSDGLSILDEVGNSLNHCNGISELSNLIGK